MIWPGDLVFDPKAPFICNKFTPRGIFTPRVYLPLGVNICPSLLNTPMGKRLRLYVF